MAAAVTMPSLGCCEDSVCIDGRVVGRRHFGFLEEVISKLASECRNRLDWCYGHGAQQVQRHRHASQGPSWREELVEGLEC